MLFLPAPAKLLSWNQKPWLRRQAHAFGCVQQVWTRLSERVSQEHLQLQPQCPAFTCRERFFKAPYWLLSAISTIYLLQMSHLALRWKRMRDVHVCKRMFFARFARSSCQNIQVWELYVTSLSVIWWKNFRATIVLSVRAKSLSSNQHCTWTNLHIDTCELDSGFSIENYLSLKPFKAKWWTRKNAVPRADSMHIFLKNSKFPKWICHENIDPLKLSTLGTFGK